MRTYLSISEWTDLSKKHIQSVSTFTDAFLKRRDHGKTHPVHDFLFTYYGCTPGKLKQWVPSFEQKLEMTDNLRASFPWFTDHWFQEKEGVLSLNLTRLQPNLAELVKFIEELCGNISSKPPRLGCFGLHEWAMVYKASLSDIRHEGHPLRLTQDQLAEFVESQTLCCTHYDAFRFFTNAAKPLNTFKPVIETRLQMEQGGCVHANMDLYKWSLKLWPWIGSDFLAKTFFLALEGREFDMRASPYDLSKLGYAAIKIETEEGRRQYQKEQLLIAEKASVLRGDLRSFCQRLLSQV